MNRAGRIIAVCGLSVALMIYLNQPVLDSFCFLIQNILRELFHLFFSIFNRIVILIGINVITKIIQVHSELFNLLLVKIFFGFFYILCQSDSLLCNRVNIHLNSCHRYTRFI